MLRFLGNKRGFSNGGHSRWVFFSFLFPLLISPASRAEGPIIWLIDTYSTALRNRSTTPDGGCGVISNDLRLLPWHLGRHGCVAQGKTLTIGASVTANYLGSLNPSDIVLRANGRETQRINAAKFGAVSKTMLEKVDENTLRGVKTIFGLDLFYWDAIRGNCEGTVENFHKLQALARKNKALLIVGNVPDERKTEVNVAVRMVWHPPAEACRLEINSLLKKHCIAPTCYVVDMAKMVEELNSTGGLRMDGNFFARKDLRPDGLHLSTMGSLILAESLLRQFDANPPLCDETETAKNEILTNSNRADVNQQRVPRKFEPWENPFLENLRDVEPIGVGR